jgi:hypothetical protein
MIELLFFLQGRLLCPEHDQRDGQILQHEFWNEIYSPNKAALVRR